MKEQFSIRLVEFRSQKGVSARDISPHDFFDFTSPRSHELSNIIENMKELDEQRLCALEVITRGLGKNKHSK